MTLSILYLLMTVMSKHAAFADGSIILKSGIANLGWFESYPCCCPENELYVPTADNTGCSCGEFCAIGPQTFSYVKSPSNNLVAFYDSADPSFISNLGPTKMIDFTYNGQTITATIADTCADSDCGGCCTEDADANGCGYLVNVEYWTMIRNFGECVSGQVTFSIYNPVMTGNIQLQNQADTQEWWVAFYIGNIDLSCGGHISDVEIMDGVNYQTWISYKDVGTNEYGYYAFENNGYDPFCAPIAVRITRKYESEPGSYDYESIIGTCFIDLVGGAVFDFGDNFCRP